jgi:hypothetical protein
LEGRIVRAIIALPLLLVAARTVVFYDVSGVFFGVALGLVGLGWFLLLRLSGQWAQAQRGSDFCAATLAACGWVPMAFEVHEHSGGQVTPVWFVPMALVLALFSLMRTEARQALRRTAVFVGLGAVALTLPVDFTLATTFAAVGVGVLSLSVGIWERQRALCVIGGLTALVGLIGAVVLSIEVTNMLNWTVLSGFGIALIFGAALLERKRAWLVSRAVRMQDGFRAWANEGAVHGEGELTQS